jgi:hypothetical protein
MRIILEREMKRASQRSHHRRTPPLHVCDAACLCTRCLTHAAHRCPPTRLLLALRSFPANCGIPPPPPLLAVGLLLFLVVVVVPVPCAAFLASSTSGSARSSCPPLVLGAVPHPPPRLDPYCIGGGRGYLGGVFATSWVSQSRCAGILGVVAAL